MKRTPLYDEHVAAGAKLVEFAGYEMPVRYTSDKGEHMAVRERCGLFDVSHMGEVFLEGNEAIACAQKLFTNDVGLESAGGSMYTGMLNKSGGFIDDCIVYRFHEQKVLICVNASNRDKDFAHIAKVAKDFDCQARDESEQWAQLAVQGPNARALVADVVDKGVLEIAPFCFALTSLSGVAGIVARTGYTGEDGFELYVPAQFGQTLWRRLVAKGAAHGLEPCGLGARDTLRLEAGLRLYGNDIDDEHTPYEAGLSWTVKRNGRDFIGEAALDKQKAAGIPRRMRGFEMKGRGIPRAGYVVEKDGQRVGVITSGTQAPYLGRPIAMGYVDVEHAAFDNEVDVIIRDKPVKATLCKLPHYKRDKQ